MCEQELKEIPYEPRLLSWSVGWSVCRSVSRFFKIRTSYFLCLTAPAQPSGSGGLCIRPSFFLHCAYRILIMMASPNFVLLEAYCNFFLLHMYIPNPIRAVLVVIWQANAFIRARSLSTD